MNEPEVFLLAEHALQTVVEQIAPDQWEIELPMSFATSQSAGGPPTLREVINYHAYDDAWVPSMLAGLTMDQAGEDMYQGDLLGNHPAGAFATIVEAACTAARGVSDLDATVHCSFGDYSVREYFWQINSFRGLRAHDLAVAIGADLPLPEALVQGLWDEIGPHAEEWRSIGVFPAAVPVPDDAPPIDRLLGLTGRQPTTV